MRPGFTRRAVVRQEDHDGVVAFAELVERTQHTGELSIGVGEEACVDLHHASGHPPLVVVHSVPVGNVGGGRRQLGAGFDDPEGDLALQRGPAPLLPAGVEASPVGVAPLRGDVVRGVAGAQGEPYQEGPLGLVAAQLAHPGDRLVRQVLTQVVAVVRGARWVDVGVVADQLGGPVVGVPAEKPVVVLEPLAERPVLERARRGPLVAGGQVPLPDREGRVALCTQDLGEGAGLVGDACRVAGEVHRKVGEHADADAVVVATREQAGAGGGAHRGGVEVGEPDPSLGEPVDRRGGDVGAVAAELSEPDVVQHDDHDVGGARSVGALRYGRGGA